jgi:hypothetical protein
LAGLAPVAIGAPAVAGTSAVVVVADLVIPDSIATDAVEGSVWWVGMCLRSVI